MGGKQINASMGTYRHHKVALQAARGSAFDAQTGLQPGPAALLAHIVVINDLINIASMNLR